MFFALDKGGNKINAYDASKEEKYTCPICGNPVILKRGMVNSDHFAHQSSECEDKWNYDMSEWHKRMQNYFPKESQEVVVNCDGKKHRADVLIGDIVLEFQYSPITAAEFEERNEFFKNAGYRLAWIFNFSSVSEDNLYPSDQKENMMIWKHPMRIFENVDNLGENNKRFALWFTYRIEEEAEEYGEIFERIIWASKHDDGKYSMRRFFISNYSIIFDEKTEVDPKYFFYSKRDYFNEALLELKRKYPFSVKYKGKKGEPRDAYICPRKNGAFGIDIWHETGCYYCKYCYMVAKTERENKNVFESYCCYPTQVRESYESSYEYECPKVDVFDL